MNKQKKDNHFHNKYNCSIEKKMYSPFVEAKKTDDEIIDGIVEECNNIFKNKIEIEILELLYPENQKEYEYFMDTVRNFAEKIGRDKDISFVQEVLDDLVKKGIMEKSGEGESAIYSLPLENEELKLRIQEEVKNLLNKIEKRKKFRIKP